MAPKKGKKKGKGKKGKKGGKEDIMVISRSSSFVSELHSELFASNNYDKYKKSDKKKAKELLAQEQAVVDSELYEARYDALTDTKNDFRQNAQELALENDLLMNQMRQTETDTIDVVTFLKKEDQKRDTKIEALEADLKKAKRKHRLEKQSFIDDFNQQINNLEKQLGKKQEDIVLMQNELMHVKEFRKKRALMQRELDEIRDTMFLSNREHKEESSRLEQKFLEERISLQKEADQKISELADRAHQEAMANLDETTRVVYKENMALSEKLSENIKEEELLKKMNGRLREENSLLVAEADNNNAVVKEKVSDSQRKSIKLGELNSRVAALESVLNHMIREFTDERQTLLNQCDALHDATRQQIAKLQRAVDSKTKECSRIRKLARKVLVERNEIERFFLESLEYVRQEIQLNQIEYKKAASRAYNRKMLDAFSGHGEFPRVRTFKKNDTSTNSVFQDLEAAEMLSQTSGQVDIGDLTWEQKEKVLRYLFARMNGTTRPPIAPHVQPDKGNKLAIQAAQQLPITQSGEVAGAIEADPYYDKKPAMFLTQSNQPDDFDSILFNKHSVIPGIGSAGHAHPLSV